MKAKGKTQPPSKKGNRHIYIGTWKPKDKHGNTLGKTFNLFAAPQDLEKCKTFTQLLRDTATLKNWRGHDGFNHGDIDGAPDAVLYEALHSGTYAGEWFIPTEDILSALYKNKDSFKPENAFVTTDRDFLKNTEWYWSCTTHGTFPSKILTQKFVDGNKAWIERHPTRVSARYIRAEPT